MDTFYVVQVVRNNEPIMALEYPKDFPIPNVNDELIIKDDLGYEHKGFVINKKFEIREDYRELNITLICD